MDKNAEVKKLPYVAAKIDRLTTESGNLKAFATVTVANSFMIHGVRVIEGNNGLFVAMPNRSFETDSGETRYKDICHPTTAEMKQRIDNQVLGAYKLAIGDTEDESNTIEEDNSISEEPDEDLETEDESMPFDFVPNM